MTEEDKQDIIRNNLSEASLLEQAAEECFELMQALLKKARKLRSENPTPKTLDEINESINEEFADLTLCFKILGLQSNYLLEQHKLNRWITRLSEDKNE